MSLKVGIVGLPNVGKSTLFNALTKNAVPAENYPFCTIDPAVGIVSVPDERLYTLSKLSSSKETIPAIVEFVDIAGLVQGASAGEGLGNEFLQHIREVDLILEVVRIFEDNNIHHVDGAIDPRKDIEIINLELILADIATVSKRLDNLARDLKRADKEAVIETNILNRLAEILRQGQLAATISLSLEEYKYVNRLQLLTYKPFLYACNRKQDALNLDEQSDERWFSLLEWFDTEAAEYVVIDAGVEAELKDLNEAEKQEFRREYGTQEAGINNLIQGAYRKLGLQSFFTTGGEETRAWTVPIGVTAPEAGAVIHTDFRDKFIRAQVVSFADLVATGSISKAREAGKLRTEGKDYIVKSGDVVEFLHG